jgi:hypothetical protein
MPCGGYDFPYSGSRARGRSGVLSGKKELAKLIEIMIGTVVG